MALEHMIADDQSGKKAEKIDGYTPDQRYFLGFGRVWCENRRPEMNEHGDHQSALAGAVAGKWRRAEHAGIPESLGM